MQTKNITPLPVYIYFVTVILLAVAGLVVSFYLSFSQYRVYTDVGYQSFCAISKAINCDTVSQSKYAVFAGVPVAVWGCIGYCFMLTLLIFSIDTETKKMRILSSLFFVALLFSLASLWLGIISSTLIHAYCIMCIASWIINFALLYMFWLIRRRYETSIFIDSLRNDFIFLKTVKLKIIPILAAFTILTIILMLNYPKYWNFTLTHDSSELATGITENGHPWIGSDSPALTIVEFSDYLCFQCRKMHFFLRNLISQHPDKLRLVHRNFPMDHTVNPIVKEPFHLGSGILSLIAISSIEQNSFWKTNDYLLNHDINIGTIKLNKIAKDLDLNLKKLQRDINSKKNRSKLSKDIIFGIKHKFNGTPTYIIKNQVYTGKIPPEILNIIIK